MQWLACRHFAGPLANYVLPLGIEDLPGLQAEDDLLRSPFADMAANMDVVCSMGVLYHRRDPLEHLRQIWRLLKPGGRMVLETLVLPSSQANDVLVPKERYARMRNVWAIPGTQRLLTWAEEAGFSNIRLVDVTPTSLQEQRTTPWMTFESLAEALVDLPDATNPGRTLEGYPAPTRAIILASR
jgi:tRNA (mo5U34)-methyltransferase